MLKDFQLKQIRDIFEKSFRNKNNDLERMNEYYLLVLKQILEWKRVLNKKPLFIGVNGSQGIGKSSLTTSIVEALSVLGIASVSISIDDFYFTRNGQIFFSKAHPKNLYIQERGYPGTHDISLGVKVLGELSGLEKRNVKIPLYDKSRHHGKGDRLPETKWKSVKTPLDVILFEGWMLGFTRVEETNISDPGLIEINHFLKQYEDWYTIIDAFICLVPEKLEYIINWRVEAEENMKAQGNPGMSGQEILDYVTKFIPAYKIYLPHLSHHAPIRGPMLKLTIGRDRLPI